jgi:hypothetical protein
MSPQQLSTFAASLPFSPTANTPTFAHPVYVLLPRIPFRFFVYLRVYILPNFSLTHPQDTIPSPRHGVHISAWCSWLYVRPLALKCTTTVTNKSLVSRSTVILLCNRKVPDSISGVETTVSFFCTFCLGWGVLDFTMVVSIMRLNLAGRHCAS